MNDYGVKEVSAAFEGCDGDLSYNHIPSSPEPGGLAKPGRGDRGVSGRALWPKTLPIRAEIVALRASSARNEDDEPEYVDCTIEILLNDPHRTRLRLPFRVSAEEAVAPGEYDEENPERRRWSADYHWKIFYALCRFGRALSQLANECPLDDDDLENNAFSVWASRSPP